MNMQLINGDNCGPVDSGCRSCPSATCNAQPGPGVLAGSQAHCAERRSFQQASSRGARTKGHMLNERAARGAPGGCVRAREAGVPPLCLPCWCASSRSWAARRSLSTSVCFSLYMQGLPQPESAKHGRFGVQPEGSNLSRAGMQPDCTMMQHKGSCGKASDCRRCPDLARRSSSRPRAPWAAWLLVLAASRSCRLCCSLHICPSSEPDDLAHVVFIKRTVQHTNLSCMTSSCDSTQRHTVQTVCSTGPAERPAQSSGSCCPPSLAGGAVCAAAGCAGLHMPPVKAQRRPLHVTVWSIERQRNVHPHMPITGIGTCTAL